MRKQRKDKGKRREHYSAPLRKRIKSKKCITLDKDLWVEIDVKAGERVQSRSKFMNDILRTILSSTKSFIKYQLKEKSRQLNLAKLDVANYNSEQEIEEAMEKTKVGR